MYVYVTPPMLQHYQNHSQLAAWHHMKQVQFVVWDFLPVCIHKPACHKLLAFAHAVLAVWGTGQHLLIVDVDEYLALPPGHKAAEFMTKCVADDMAVARLPRLNVICDDCQGPDLELWDATEGLETLKHYSTGTSWEPRVSDKLVVDPERVHGIFYPHRTYSFWSQRGLE